MTDLRKNYIMFLIGFSTSSNVRYARSPEELKELTNRHLAIILKRTKQEPLTSDEKNYFDLADDWVKTMVREIGVF